MSVFKGIPRSVEFFDCPRVISDGRPFVGARLLDGAGAECATALAGVGYTRGQALRSLRGDVLGIGGPAEALAVIDAALSLSPLEEATPEQRAVHSMAEALYDKIAGHFGSPGHPRPNRRQRRARR